MLEKLIPAKADPILGLGKLFAADSRDNKIDLGVGVYKDADGKTPIMTAIKKAEKLGHLDAVEQMKADRLVLISYLNEMPTEKEEEEIGEP